MSVDPCNTILAHSHIDLVIWLGLDEQIEREIETLLTIRKLKLEFIVLTYTLAKLQVHLIGSVLVSTKVTTEALVHQVQKDHGAG